MVKAVRDGKQGSRGNHATLAIPDQILLTLQYWREYRTTCVRWIAQLGGFIGRKGDGEPGVKTIWRG